eukprot:9979265-Ditylum_brightwellii.AAC.1
MANPGIITEIYPTLVQHEDFCAELEGYLGLCKAPDNDIATKWIKNDANKNTKETSQSQN